MYLWSFFEQSPHIGMTARADGSGVGILNSLVLT